jgi:hypothetical protein
MHPTHGQDIMMLAYCNNKRQQHDATRTRHALHRVSCGWAKPANAIEDQCTGTQLTQMACCHITAAGCQPQCADKTAAVAHSTWTGMWAEGKIAPILMLSDHASWQHHDNLTDCSLRLRTASTHCVDTPHQRSPPQQAPMTLNNARRLIFRPTNTKHCALPRGCNLRLVTR